MRENWIFDAKSVSFPEIFLTNDHHNKGLESMNKIFKTAIIIATAAGLQAVGAVGASASQSGLLQYAQDPTVQKVETFEPIKVASRRSRRRNQAIAAGVAVGIAGLIIADTVRSKPRRARRYRYSYPGHRTCRRWARRCDYGSRRSCRNWNRRCR